MRKYLLPNSGKFYKANLHCHTTVSDGTKTPQEIKDLYMKNGYSVVAYSDHNVMVRHDELTDENFVALHAFEAAIDSKPDAFGRYKYCHIGFISGDPDVKKQPFQYRAKGEEERNKGHLLYDPEKDEILTRVYGAEPISRLMKLGQEQNYFVVYNHPTWSGEDYPEYTAYQNMDAMEIFNSESLSDGYYEINDRVYDDMLRTGHKIFCIAADDNHNGYPEGHVLDAACRGYIQIKSEKLDYKTIFKNLKAGNFYASQGPAIYDLYVEDGKIHVTTSPCDRVYLVAWDRRRNAVVDTVGNGITSAEFPLYPTDGYVRLTVVGKDGKCAFTNAYFTDEFFKK